MNRKPRRSLTLTAAIGAVLVLVGACSSSGGNNNTSAGTSTGAAATGSTPPGAAIVVGMICSCSGPYSSNYLLEQDAANAWAKSVNDAGGINGHPVKMITKDDGADPTTALQQVKELVEQDKIIALVGDLSVNSTAFANYLSQKGVPVVGGNTSEAPFSTDPNFFVSGGVLAVNMTNLFLDMQKHGLKHIGMTYCAEAPVCAQLAGLASTVAKVVPGIQVSSAKIAATSPSYTSQCVGFRSDGVDALFSGVTADVGLRVIDACKQQGFAPKIFTDISTTGHAWLSDPNVQGSVLSSINANFEDTSVPGVKAFIDAMNKYYPGDVDKAQFSGTTLYPWASGKLFEAAAKAGNVGPTSTSADVKKGLYALKDETLDGLAPPLTFSEGKTTFPACSFLMALENGKFTSPQGADAKCLTSEQLTTLKSALGS